MNTKAVLRTEYQKRRDSLTEEQIADCSIQISNLSLTLNIWEYSIYHLFMTNEKNKEIDTSYLLSVIQGKDKQPVIPKIVDDNRLEHFLLNDQTLLKNNRWGIPEPLSGITINPKQIEVVFVPLLVFDQHGHRVGYGKGYYDRFLDQCSESTLKVGLTFFDPVTKIEDIETHDISLDFALTPERIYAF
ncbi:MAG: 5-formyltetrahydrofolate cyclo-ligase [Bacteroidota bacterium]|nr:5-formyltetrahydrofolate cyclo-ligase [Bacteroidota bacterium]MEC9135143.1 5-formyltetrahydrofolate cyclo-ligase [Bacteroidota bacterium]